MIIEPTDDDAKNPRQHGLSVPVYQYLLERSLRETEEQRALRTYTLNHVDQNEMMTSPEQVQLLGWLIRAIRAKKAIEIGVYTGYGSLAMALALPQSGILHACDIDERWPSIGVPYWREAGIFEKIRLHIAPALKTLEQLYATEGGDFDFIFIDADKKSYPDYYDWSLKLLKPGGVMVFDNMLWVGETAVMECINNPTRTIDELLKQIHPDDRVSISLIPIGQGMLLVQKNYDAYF